MDLTINGEPRTVAGVRTVRDLVKHLDLGRGAVAVEVNKKVVPRKLHEQTDLHDGDRIEIVTLVGGG